MSDQSVGRGPRFSRVGLRQVVLLIAVLLLACACSGGASSAPPTTSHQGPSVFVAKLVSVGSATTAQLHEASTIIVHRLQEAGSSGVQAVVTGSAITVTATSDFARLRSMLPAVLVPASLLFRPVLCAAPPYSPPAQGQTPTDPPSCGAQYQLTATNLNVDTNTGQPQSNIGPDPALVAYPDTASPNDLTDDLASQTVLLETTPNAGFGGDRLVLGPAQVVGAEITSAQAAFNSPDWVVNLNLNSSGSRDWDSLATQQFHAYIGIDLDAQVISAPLTLPNQAAFTSFGGKVQISEHFTKSAAKSLALDLQFGALPVRLEVAGTS
jgi:preprotein translocase subunit SecD